MVVNVNGAAREIEPGCTGAALLEQLGLNAKTVVVQLNDEIVDRNTFAAAHIQEGDTVELVRFVGGG